MLGRIESILGKHGLGTQKIEKSSVGFRNEVYFTENHVVKLYGKGNKNGYHKELWFYRKAHPSFSPALVGYGDDYIILERIYGTGLFRLWRDMNDRQRQAAVQDIAAMIRSVNAVDYGDAREFFSISPDWRAGLLGRINRNLWELKKINGIPDSLAARVRQYARDHSDCLDDEALFLVYADLHFDNLLMTEGGRLYLLDYEMLEVGPRDLVLDVWQRMLIHPFTYANEDDHEKTIPQDYTHILAWLSGAAPELFSHPRVRERVNLYGIVYELDILMDYPMGDWPMERLEAYMSGMKWL